MQDSSKTRGKIICEYYNISVDYLMKGGETNIKYYVTEAYH